LPTSRLKAQVGILCKMNLSIVPLVAIRSADKVIATQQTMLWNTKAGIIKIILIIKFISMEVE